jgi:predicted choloylglycine hydrolase
MAKWPTDCEKRASIISSTTAVHHFRAKRITPHVLRHTCAMMILQATGDLRKVSLYASCLILVWASKNCQVIGNSDFEENVTRCSVTSGAM